MERAAPQRTLSLRQVITNDYWAFAGVAYPSLTWIGYLFYILTGIGADWLGRPRLAGADSMQVFFNLSMAFTAIGVPVVVWRWMQLSRIHKNGQEVAGKISRVDFSRERIRVDFTYSFQGEPRQVRASVHRSAQTQEVHPRKRVVVVVDAQRPDKAFIRDWMCTPAYGEAQPEDEE